MDRKATLKFIEQSHDLAKTTYNTSSHLASNTSNPEIKTLANQVANLSMCIEELSNLTKSIVEEAKLI